MTEEIFVISRCIKIKCEVLLFKVSSRFSTEHSNVDSVVAVLLYILFLRRWFWICLVVCFNLLFFVLKALARDCGIPWEYLLILRK